MDLREKRELDLAGQMARVRAHARPWRSLAAFVLALAAAAIAHEAGRGFTGWLQGGQLAAKVVTISATAAFCLFGGIAVIGLSGKAGDLLRPVTGSAHAAVVRYAAVLAGGIAVLLVALELLKQPIGQVVVGAGLTTILVGIAAQQSLSNVFAGIVLLMSRPFAVGDVIHLRSGALNGPLEGTVTEIGITYVRLDTGNGTLHLPNSQVLASAVGRLAAAGTGQADGAAGAEPPSAPVSGRQPPR